MLSPKVLFNRLDKDQDGKLSLEEFAAGMRRLRQMTFPGGRPTPYGPGARGAGARRPPGRADKGGPRAFDAEAFGRAAAAFIGRSIRSRGRFGWRGMGAETGPGPGRRATRPEPKRTPSRRDWTERREQMRKQLMEKYDKNQDGKIDEGERRAMRAERSQRRPQGPRPPR